MKAFEIISVFRKIVTSKAVLLVLLMLLVFCTHTTTPSRCIPGSLFIDGFGNTRGGVYTADNKYIIYSAGNQYGTDYMEARDASTCEVVFERKWAMSPMEGSNNGLVALAPKTSRIITGGQLVNLDDAGHRITLSRESGWTIVAAAWSADETYLGYIACQEREKVCTLYVAFGDGSKSQELSSLETNRRVKWIDNTLIVMVQYYRIESQNEDIRIDGYFHGGE